MVLQTISGAVKSVTVIVRDTGPSGLPQTSVAVQVSVIVPHTDGVAENVDKLDKPLIKHPPLSPLE